jgi:hypothetical protein
MADPCPQFYDNDDATLIDSANKINFGNISKGTISEPLDDKKRPIHLWNRKGSTLAVDMLEVKIGVKDNGGGNTGEFISGTVQNGYQPVFEARSDGSQGITDDAQSSWTRVGGDTFLNIGDIPTNARRSIYVRINLPPDATVESNEPILVVDYTFES